MKTHRVWLEIMILGTAIACAVALFVATIGVAVVAARAAASQQATRAATEHAYEGMVTCSRCGAKHSAAIGQSASVCVRMCVHNGSTFALVDSDEFYLLNGDLDVLKRLAGQRAHVVGTLSGKTITVASAVAAT